MLKIDSEGISLDTAKRLLTSGKIIACEVNGEWYKYHFYKVDQETENILFDVSNNHFIDIEVFKTIPLEMLNLAIVPYYKWYRVIES